LADWQEDVIYLSLDTSMFWDQYCLVRLAVVHRGRALPVVWRVLERQSASVSFSEYREMLYQAVDRLPKGVKVVVLADRGFVHTDCMRAMSTQLGLALSHSPQARYLDLAGRQRVAAVEGFFPKSGRSTLLSQRQTP
jgi:hypothetical protein